MTRALWSMLLVAALYWPSRALSILDGLPLNGVAEAIVLGVAMPFLWVVHRRFLDARWVRGAVLALLALKAAGALVLTQEGLCARFSTDAPFRAEVLTIPIEEPRGVLRSWDVRADRRADAPSCTAIVDRPYAALEAFPAWFLNVTDFAAVYAGERPTQRHIVMDVRGAVTIGEAGRFAMALDRDTTMTGRIDDQTFAAPGDDPAGVTLSPGVLPVMVP